MTFDLSTIPWSEIAPNSVVITRLEGERFDQFLYALRDNLGDTVKVAPMATDTEVFVIAETDLNKMGWFRRT